VEAGEKEKKQIDWDEVKAILQQVRPAHIISSRWGMPSFVIRLALTGRPYFRDAKKERGRRSG